MSAYLILPIHSLALNFTYTSIKTFFLYIYDVYHVQSSLRSKQVPERIHLLGSESSDSMFRLALVMKVAPRRVV